MIENVLTHVYFCEIKLVAFKTYVLYQPYTVFLQLTNSEANGVLLNTF